MFIIGSAVPESVVDPDHANVEPYSPGSPVHVETPSPCSVSALLIVTVESISQLAPATVITAPAATSEIA